jgi:septum site-determining protein MinC
MSSGIAAASDTDDRWGEVPEIEARPAAILKGGPRGLEILVDRGAATDAIASDLTRRLEEAPGFFRGSDVRVRIDGALPAGCLARLEEIATRFELSIVEVGPSKPRPGSSEVSAPVPRPAFAAGSAPALVPEPETALVPEPDAAVIAIGRAKTEPQLAIELELADAEALVPAVAQPAPAAPEIIEPASPKLVEAAASPSPAPAPPPERTRMVVGPVRSGVILDHPGNLVVVGDVNPGAEVRAQGNIVILGRLRGIAHAGIGREHGFILALRLEPQQLRIGRVVARSPDAPGRGTEIAYVTDKHIVVESYAGKLPFGLAASV